MRVLVVRSGKRSIELSEELIAEGVSAEVVEVSPSRSEQLIGVFAVIVEASRHAITPELVRASDRAGTRIVALGEADTRILGRYGLASALPADIPGWQVVDALNEGSPHLEITPHIAGKVVTVWGAHGSPGRSTVAITLTVELARLGSSVSLVDADTVAPSIALLLGLGDESPGVAAAARRAEQGSLDTEELRRIASTLETSGGTVEVLEGLNRPSRWPEVSAHRLRETLRICRAWNEVTVVDIASALEQDEELTYDMEGPRRNAAASAALEDADEVIAVVSANPLGVARFIRAYPELRATAGNTRVHTVVNSVRPGPFGVDARGQVRRTLERFTGIDTDITFCPLDLRGVDSALLHARPIADVTPRSPLVAAVRELAARIGDNATAGSPRESSRGARPLRRARGVREESRS